MTDVNINASAPNIAVNTCIFRKSWTNFIVNAFEFWDMCILLTLQISITCKLKLKPESLF